MCAYRPFASISGAGNSRLSGRQPEAQDTIEGILHWWVLDSCIRDWAPKIAKTVAKLVERGFLEEKRSSDGKIFYRVSADYLSTLQQRPPLNHDPDDDE